jgi:hypothetical protein
MVFDVVESFCLAFLYNRGTFYAEFIGQYVNPCSRHLIYSAESYTLSPKLSFCNRL